MTRIGIESAFEVLMRARALEAQGKKIIHLEIGQPDFPTPRHIIEAGQRALDEGWTGYGPTPGFSDFRDAIAEYVSRTRGISVTGKNVVVCTYLPVTLRDHAFAGVPTDPSRCRGSAPPMSGRRCSP